MKLFSTPVLLLVTLVGAGLRNSTKTARENIFEPKLVALCVEDIETSVAWYTENLGFEIEKEVEEYPAYGLKLAFLAADGFHLEILEKNNSVKQSEVLKNEDHYIGGIFKIGFKSNDLDSTFHQLKSKADVDFVTDIYDLPEYQSTLPWPDRFFLIKDPDGNFIQFFDTGTRGKSLWLIMITVDSLDESISWYGKNLGFRHIATFGDTGNKRAIVERDDLIVELYEPREVFNFDESTMGASVLGFKKLGLGVSDIISMDSVFRAEKTEIVIPIEGSDFEWAEQAMIIKDLEGNWTQLFEIGH